MRPDQLARTLQEFLADARSAAIYESGEELFHFSDDSSSARYSISGDEKKSLLHLWSDERNLVRRILEAEVRKDSLLLHAQRFGHSKPVCLEIFRERDRRAPSARRAARSAYNVLLTKVLQRNFPDLGIARLTIAMDLERSFGPTYSRGLLRRGRSAIAVLGVNAQETQTSVDAALTFGLLWLDLCRQRETRAAVEALMLIVPRGTSCVVRERMASLNHAAARFELYELDEREHSLTALDCADRGNMATRLVRCVDQAAACERFAASVERVLRLAPALRQRLSLHAASPAELSFRLHGLEFARARLAQGAALRSEMEISFGTGAHETLLTAENEVLFTELMTRLAAARRLDGDRRHPLWRMHPERWLEAKVLEDLAAIDSTLEGSLAYSQVPAFSASDRAMIDVLTCTREGRLAVIELKADEDIHLPMQGLDYWTRVAWHHARGEFREYGYFPQCALAPQPPLLILVAPALHIHPATDTLLRYLSPEVEWTLAGIDERWREGVRVVFRKRSGG